MPVITMYAPEMTKEQKAELIRAFAEDGSRILNIPVQAFNTTIFEVNPENVGHGNITLAEALKEEGKKRS